MSHCIICDKELELVQDTPYQPYDGGEVQFIFSFGSRKFDKSSGTTVYRGIICDDCAVEYVDKMKCKTYSMGDLL